MPEDDNYSDGMDSPSVEAPEKESSQDQDESDSKTALLPKDICPETMNPGDQLTLRVVRVQDDQLEVKYESKPDEETGKEYEPQPETAPSDGGESESNYE